MPRTMNRNVGYVLGDEGYLPLRKDISSDDRKLISKVFYRSDSDFKGYLTRADLKVAVLELFGYKPCKAEVDGLITTYGDRDSHPAGLSLDQFESAMASKMAGLDEDEVIRETFLAFDTQCRGFLREEDVERVVRQVAPHLPTLTVATAFREIDQDGDGRISFRDFQMMMKYDFDCHI